MTLGCCSSNVVQQYISERTAASDATAAIEATNVALSNQSIAVTPAGGREASRAGAEQGQVGWKEHAMKPF